MLKGRILMQKIDLITKLDINSSHISFVLPISYKDNKKKNLIQALEANGYTYFQLADNSKEKDLYGERIGVSKRDLEQYFLPYIEDKIFPPSLNDQGFHRYTKSFKEEFNFRLKSTSPRFLIQSTDVILGSFGIAFLTIRVQLKDEKKELSDVLDFMHHFRTVEAKLKEEKGIIVVDSNNIRYPSINKFIFEYIFRFLKEFILHDEKSKGYHGSLPYFEDERMYVTAFLFSKEGSPITNDQLYRMGTLDGRSPDGDDFISTSNTEYIQRYLDGHLHDRWGPNSYTMVTQHAYITVTNVPPKSMMVELSQYMGTHYYNFLLHYFYKIMLHRISYEYSEIDWKKDEESVKPLIKLITLFSSWHFFHEVSTRSEGKELSKLFRESLNINNLSKEATNTLHELYETQEHNASYRMNMLLFFLTVFTVMSGIFGMNLVIRDWDSPVSWEGILNYTFFEWVTLLTAVVGIGLSIYLIVTTIGKILINKFRERKSKSDKL